jgi:hypothetical protein
MIMALLAILLGAGLLTVAVVHKRWFGATDTFRAYSLAGAGLMIIGTMKSGMLDSRGGTIVGLMLFAGWLIIGVTFALQSRKERR